MKQLIFTICLFSLLSCEGATKRWIPKIAAAVSGGNNITFRNKSEDVTSTGTTSTPAEPTGATTDDVLIAVVAANPTATIGIPAGWTSITSGSSTTPDFKYNVCYIRRTGSAPSYAFTMGAAVYREVHVFCYSGVVNTGTPYEAASAGTKTRSNTTTVTCDSVTTVNANAMVLAIAICWAGNNVAYTPPSGYTIRVRNSNGDDVVMADKKRVAAGAESPGTFGAVLNATNDRFVISVALQD